MVQKKCGFILSIPVYLMLIYYIKTKVVKLTSLEFRTKLVSQIIEKYVEDTENYLRGGRPSTADNPFRLVERHFPSYIPITGKKVNATKQTVCYLKKTWCPKRITI